MHEKCMKTEHRNSPRKALYLRDENKQYRRNKMPNSSCMELIHSEKRWKPFAYFLNKRGNNRLGEDYWNLSVNSY